jgi:transketolase
LSKFGVIFVFTHDSIGLGEDGPTHQPIETLAILRSTPNLNVFRPADAAETSAAYAVALESVSTPTVICCSRSNVPEIATSSIEKARQGAYVAVEEESPDVILVGTGSEVSYCLDAVALLTSDTFGGIKARVVSMPCQEVFLQQPSSYRESILPGNIPTLSVEAASSLGWHRFSHAQISVDEFGKSGSGDDVFRYFGYTPENVAQKAKELVEFYKKAGNVPNLNLRPEFESPHTIINGNK